MEPRMKNITDRRNDEIQTDFFYIFGHEISDPQKKRTN